MRVCRPALGAGLMAAPSPSRTQSDAAADAAITVRKLLAQPAHETPEIHTTYIVSLLRYTQSIVSLLIGARLDVMN